MAENHWTLFLTAEMLTHSTMLSSGSRSNLMPEGKDFVDGLLAGVVVDAVAGVEGSFKCSPAGLSRRHRNK